MQLKDFPNAQTRLCQVYGNDALDSMQSRYENAMAQFTQHFGDRDGVIVVSAPGRTEIGGNHTDHNCGHVLAAAISLDVIAVTAPSDDGVIRVISDVGAPFTLALEDLQPQPQENGTSAALVRGVAAGLSHMGYRIGAFCAYVTSDVLVGSGLSSSAAFESLIGAIFSHLFNAGRVTPVELAVAGKLAENEYYKKPSGMMDQTATANGGFVAIDFADTNNPIIDAVQFDIGQAGYALVVVATGDDHENLTDQYASMPREMKAVAQLLGCEVLRQTDKKTVLSNIPKIRSVCGDRALLRAIHFFDDDARAVREAQLLREGDFDGFLTQIRESGLSSIRYLQNISDINNPQSQGIALALCLAEQYLGTRGACRVHGGGFAGTTLNFVPKDMLDGFIKMMEDAFCPGCCHVLQVRRDGAIRIL